MSIPRESIKIIQPTESTIPPVVRYEWICPQCLTTTHGDARSDTIFEIRHDPLCIYCRVKNGEFKLNGSNFVRIPKVVPHG